MMKGGWNPNEDVGLKFIAPAVAWLCDGRASWTREHMVTEATCRFRLGGHTATNHTGSAKDTCAEERQGSGLGNSRWVRQTDEALLIFGVGVLAVSFRDGGGRDPVEFADQRRRDCAVAESWDQGKGRSRSLRDDEQEGAAKEYSEDAGD